MIEKESLLDFYVRIVTKGLIPITSVPSRFIDRVKAKLKEEGVDYE